MRRLTIAAIGLLALSGCTGAHIKKPAVCDGKHRRPANPYGSVLPTLPVPVPASQDPSQSMIAPGPGVGPGALPAPPPAPPSAPVPPADPAVPEAVPQTGTASKPTAAISASQRQVALSYLPC